MSLGTQEIDVNASMSRDCDNKSSTNGNDISSKTRDSEDKIGDTIENTKINKAIKISKSLLRSLMIVLTAPFRYTYRITKFVLVKIYNEIKSISLKIYDRISSYKVAKEDIKGKEDKSIHEKNMKLKMFREFVKGRLKSCEKIFLAGFCAPGRGIDEGDLKAYGTILAITIADVVKARPNSLFVYQHSLGDLKRGLQVYIDTLNQKESVSGNTASAALDIENILEKCAIGQGKQIHDLKTGLNLKIYYSAVLEMLDFVPDGMVISTLNRKR